MTPDEFRRLCAALYGYGWQTRLAEVLGVNARTVRRWAAGTAVIPQAVAVAVRCLAGVDQ